MDAVEHRAKCAFAGNPRLAEIVAPFIADTMLAEVKEVKRKNASHVMVPKKWPREFNIAGNKTKGTLRLYMEEALSDEPQTVAQMIEGSTWDKSHASATLRRMAANGEAHHCAVLPDNQYLWKAGPGESLGHHSWSHIVVENVTKDWKSSREILARVQKVRPETTLNQINARLRKLLTEGKIEKIKRPFRNLAKVLWRLPE